MSFLNVSLQGGFGNQLFQMAFAKAYALRRGMQICCGPWVGDQIFDFDHLPQKHNLPRFSETDVTAGNVCDGDHDIRGYFQSQSALIYTRQQVQRWFRLKHDVEFKLQLWLCDNRPNVLAHRRVGDYPGYGYVVPSIGSYEFAAYHYAACHSLSDITWITEEAPATHPDFTGALAFLPDFYRMMRAKTLLRGNSTFSWWAATLGNARVFSPVVEGIPGGHHDVAFVEGNHPRFANLDFVTDLHLPE